MASVISTLLSSARMNHQSRAASRSVSPWPASRAAARPLPSPNQPGTIWRLWVQPNTHGIARSPSSPAPASGRDEGREPMLSRLSSCTGVDVRK